MFGPLGSLPSDHKVPDSIPDSTVGFFSGTELLHGTYGLGFPSFNILCSCSVLCSLMRRALQSADHRLGKTYQSVSVICGL